MSDLQHKELSIKCGALIGVIITSDNERRVKVTSFKFTEKQLNAFAVKIENQAKEANKLEIERLREALERIANVDYRGNRSDESVIAYKAINKYKPKANNET